MCTYVCKLLGSYELGTITQVRILSKIHGLNNNNNNSKTFLITLSQLFVTKGKVEKDTFL